MYTFLVVLLIVDALVLVAAVLLQSAKGGGLAASFGGATTAADAFIGTRQASNLLSKASWWCGGAFLFIAFVLQLMTTSSRGAPKSVLDQPLSSTPAPAPVAPSGTNSAIPLSPATKAPSTAPATAPASAPTPATKKP